MKELKNTNTAIQPKLIYYFDPLCGWCYGFSPVIAEIEKAFKGRLDVEVICGGLFLGNRVGGVNEVAPHIQAGAYKSVEGRTGVKFGEVFLQDVFGAGKMVLDSLPPTLALCIIKEKFPEKQLEFASLLLKAVYFDGLHPSDVTGLARYAAQVGFDQQEFIAKMGNVTYRAAAQREFEQFRASQYTGMPALVLVQEGKQIPIAQGYMDLNNLQQRLAEYL